MATRSVARKHEDLGLSTPLTPRSRAVLRAFAEARRLARGFLLSSGVLPEVSESCSDCLFRIVQHIALHQLDGNRHAAGLRASLRRALPSTEAFERVDQRLTALQSSEITAAYVFGLSVGLALRALPNTMNF
jgi:hypothetical protein